MAARRKKKPNSRQIAFTRFMLIVAFFAFWMLGISARLVHLQVTQHEWLRDRAVDQRQDVKKSKMLRGTIFDRDDRPLAMSVRVKTLYADATEITDVDSTANTLAGVLGLNAKELAAQLDESKKARKRFVPLLKKLDESTVQKLNKALELENAKKADLPLFEGLHWIEDQIRSYPNGTMAAQVIGFSNLDDTGMAGVELSQDDLLHGAVVKTMQERDRIGRVYGETVYERERPSDIALTIGKSFQAKAEEALEESVRSSNALSGTAIVLRVKTGEILAMANYPSFDPNEFKQATPERYKNHSIQGFYAPGSVMKLVTYSAGLEKRLFTPDDLIDAGNGTIEVAKHKFTDSHHVGSVTYAQALAHSSNVCAIKTGLRVGREDQYAMLQKMGFGSKTGIELPAETMGILRPIDRWNGDSLASMSIGYEIGVTPLQLASAFATIANDGIRVQPHIIREIRRPGEPPVASSLSESQRVVSVETARNMQKMLRQVVLTGTGRRAQLNGYTSAGKTGTAWKVNTASKRVDASKYMSTFVGFAPANNPEIVIAVMIDEPKAGARDGGQVAAPVFRQIAEHILPELGVKPDGTTPAETTVVKEIPEAVKGDPQVKDVDAESPKGKEPSEEKKSPKQADKGLVSPEKLKELKKENKKKPVPGKNPQGNTTASIEAKKKSLTGKNTRET